MKITRLNIKKKERIFNGRRLYTRRRWWWGGGEGGGEGRRYDFILNRKSLLFMESNYIVMKNERNAKYFTWVALNPML